MKQLPRIILLIPTRRSYERGILRGIARYAKLQGPWAIYHPRDFYSERKRHEDLFHQMASFEADGVIMWEQFHQEDNAALLAMELPTIVCPYSDNPRLTHLPLLLPDDDQVGRIGAQYLINRGYDVFGFCGYSTMPWSQRRTDAFCCEVSETGFATHVYQPAPDKTPQSSEHETSLLMNWLHGLPKPIGIMGVDNDEIGCSLNTPALTSIALNTETCGYRAAQLLDEWIRTKKKPEQGISVLPTRVIGRQSTDVLHIEDPAVAQAIRFIRNSSARPVQVTDVLGVVCVSLRTLQQRFQKVLGRTINDEINRARMERVSQMLIQTDLPIKQIASDLGYSSPKHIARAFRNEKGMTLAEFRKKYGQKPDADVSG